MRINIRLDSLLLILKTSIFKRKKEIESINAEAKITASKVLSTNTIISIKIPFIFMLLIILLPGCHTSSKQDKYQGKRNNNINIKDLIEEIDFEPVYLSNFTKMYPLGNYLIMSDYKSLDNKVYIFDNKGYNLISETAPHGQGPNEISNLGNIAVNEENREFYVTDHGKQKVFSYELDSVLINSSYLPSIKANLKGEQFPSEYIFINDSICFGIIIEPNGNSEFDMLTAEWNISTGEIIPMKYIHPEIERKRISFALSKDDGIYVESYNHHDLITICDLNGNLKFNIYGNKWDSKTSNENIHFGNVVIHNKNIIASYSGKSRLYDDSLPTELIVFDINGNYLYTLETGYKIVSFSCDKHSNRLIFHFDDEIQFGYLDLEGIVD